MAESLKAETSGTGIDVKVINPGFVKTPLTDQNDFDMPMIITPEEAAESIAKGLLKDEFEIHFPRRMTMLMKFVGQLPAGMYFKLAQKIKQKREKTHNE